MLCSHCLGLILWAVILLYSNSLLPDTTTTNLFSAIKQKHNYIIMTEQRKAIREAIRLNELVAYAISTS